MCSHRRVHRTASSSRRRRRWLSNASAHPFPSLSLLSPFLSLPLLSLPLFLFLENAYKGIGDNSLIALPASTALQRSLPFLFRAAIDLGTSSRAHYLPPITNGSSSARRTPPHVPIKNTSNPAKRGHGVNPIAACKRASVR